MLLAEVVSQLSPRVQRLGLVDPETGFFDEAELETYLHAAMRFLANRYQLQHFLAMNRHLLTTSPSLESYTIPPNYGFIAPLETRRSGLAVTEQDGTNPTNLEYYDPARYSLLRTGILGKPAWFTVTDNLLHFQPIPDAVYTIEAIERSLRDGTEVPDSYVEAVKIEALWRLASDVGKATPLLQDEHTEVIRTIVNNEQRARQKFYTARERIGFGRGRRRYGL